MLLSMSDLEHLIRPASDLALSFARQLEHIEVEEKSPGQFASEADHAVELLIRTDLHAKLGKVAVIGEERGGSLDQSTSGWAIDPIDGTSNFLRGLPIWGISIGYLDRGRSVAGVMTLPALGITLAAQLGAGVTLNGNPLHSVNQKERNGVRLIALGENDFEPGLVTDARAQHFRDQGYGVVRYRCAVFALANVALGRLDGYIENGCGLWDIAAAWIICKEAGLDVDVQEVAPGRYSVAALDRSSGTGRIG